MSFYDGSPYCQFDGGGGGGGGNPFDQPLNRADFVEFGTVKTGGLSIKSGLAPDDPIAYTLPTATGVPHQVLTRGTLPGQALWADLSDSTIPDDLRVSSVTFKDDGVPGANTWSWNAFTDSSVPGVQDDKLILTRVFQDPFSEDCVQFEDGDVVNDPLYLSPYRMNISDQMMLRTQNPIQTSGIDICDRPADGGEPTSERRWRIRTLTRDEGIDALVLEFTETHGGTWVQWMVIDNDLNVVTINESLRVTAPSVYDALLNVKGELQMGVGATGYTFPSTRENVPSGSHLALNATTGAMQWTQETGPISGPATTRLHSMVVWDAADGGLITDSLTSFDVASGITAAHPQDSVIPRGMKVGEYVLIRPKAPYDITPSGPTASLNLFLNRSEAAVDVPDVLMYAGDQLEFRYGGLVRRVAGGSSIIPRLTIVGAWNSSNNQITPPSVLFPNTPQLDDFYWETTITVTAEEHPTNPEDLITARWTATFSSSEGTFSSYLYVTTWDRLLAGSAEGLGMRVVMIDHPAATGNSLYPLFTSAVYKPASTTPLRNP